MAGCGGGGGITIGEFFEGAIDSACRRAHECRDTYPNANFEQVYGTSVDQCLEMFGPSVTAATTQYQESVDAGRSEYDGGKAQACLDDEAGYSCDVYWTVGESDNCEQIFTGLVPTGEHCEFNEECADLTNTCSPATFTCELPTP